MKAWKKLEQGFTLAELLIVVAIIAVLVAVSIPIFAAQLEKSREETDIANLRSAYSIAQTDSLAETYRVLGSSDKWVAKDPYTLTSDPGGYDDLNEEHYFYAYYDTQAGELKKLESGTDIKKASLGKGTGTQGGCDDLTIPIKYNEKDKANSAFILVVIHEKDGVAQQARAGFRKNDTNKASITGITSSDAWFNVEKAS